MEFICRGALDVDFNRLHEGFFDVDICSHAVQGKLDTSTKLFFTSGQAPFFFLKLPNGR